MNVDELLRRYAAGERDFSGIRLYAGILIAVNLSRVNLSRAHLEAVSLREANLERANLSNVNLSCSSLTKANLSQADLSGANFCRSGFPYVGDAILPAELTEANLQGANLNGADLRQVYLSEANLSKAKLEEANLRGADLTRVDLREANLTGAILAEANLSQANLTGAILANADLREATLAGTTMPDGTVGYNFALDFISKKLSHLKRKAWKPITKRGDGDLTASKFAGKPWLSANEKWPTCPNCRQPMRFFLQLNLQELPESLKSKFGNGLLQMFYCLNEVEIEHETWVESATMIGDLNGNVRYVEIKSCENDCLGYQPFSRCQLVRIVQPDITPA